MPGRALAAVLAVAAAGLAAALSAAAPPALLPNLVQEPPSALVVARVEGRWHLGFASIVDNLAPVPFAVVAARHDRSVPTMSAFQVAAGRRLARVGTLRYAVTRTHEHWHLLPFELYELRRVADGALVGAARKAGFCLTDSRRVQGDAPASFTSRCGSRRPDAVRLGEGISAGWADVYGPEREGQFVDVTELAAGRYALVNRVNAGGAIRESSYADDVAATLFDLAWPGGPDAAPALSVVGACAGAADCGAARIR